MPSDLPLISITVPAYNQGAYLVEAIESIYAQEYPNLEVVVVNDGATDNTDEIAHGLVKKFPSLTYIVQKNTGLAGAVNTGYSHCHGTYIARIDADDTIPATYITELYHTLQAAEQKMGKDKVAFSYCDAHMFGAIERVVTAGEYSLSRLLLHNYIHASSLVRADALANVGYLNTNMRYGLEDWNLWLSLAEAGFRGVYCRSTFLNYRQKEGGGMLSDAGQQRHEAMINQARENHPKLYGSAKNQVGLLARRGQRKAKHLLGKLSSR